MFRCPSVKIEWPPIMIYMNEVPKLHHLMYDQEWMHKNITNYNDVRHNTINFVGNSNSVISFTDPEEINYYLHRFFQIIKIYYNDMKLKINADKTNLLVIARPTTKTKTNDVQIIAYTETIKPKPEIKNLGWFLNERLSMDTTLNASSAQSMKL